MERYDFSVDERSVDVGEEDSVTATLEVAVSVIRGGIVTRRPARVVVVLFGPPSTGTTEYGARLRASCGCSLGDNGNEFVIVDNIVTNNSIDMLSLMVKGIALNFRSN